MTTPPGADAKEPVFVVAADGARPPCTCVIPENEGECVKLAWVPAGSGRPHSDITERSILRPCKALSTCI